MRWIHALRTVLLFVLAAAAALSALGAGAQLGARQASPPPPPAPLRLPPVYAEGIRTDTLFLGGYAHGSFSEALRVLASDLSESERAMVGRHLDKIFAVVLGKDGLGEAGRLRVAYERTVRPDGSTRSIEVLTAEAAVDGELHTAYYFEAQGKPGYYDPFGRSLDEHAWAEPLPVLRVTSAYGSHRLHPILHRVLPHTGVDLGARQGTPVRAAADGLVTRAGWWGGYGNLIEVQHPNGYSTRYGHLSRLARGLRLGQLVHQGEVIGYVGMTGLATGPHLHFEVRRHGRPVDPLQATEEGQVGSELDDGPLWAHQRTRLALLLRRAPTLLTAAGGRPF